MLSFSEYAKKLHLLESIGNTVLSSNVYLEDFFDMLESAGFNINEVMTSDIATVIKPILFTRRKMTYENAAPGSEDWIKKNKSRFKKEYGETNYEQILYATSWKLFGAK